MPDIAGRLKLNPINLKKKLKYVAPPLLLDLARHLKRVIRKERPEWEYLPQGWQTAQTDPAIKGWNVEAVLQAYKARWPGLVKQLETVQPFSVSPETLANQAHDTVYHNTVMSYGYVLGRVAQHKTAISMLDWGGGIGYYNLLSRALLPDLELDYHCKEVSLLAQYGQELFPQAHFYSDDNWLTRSYDFVLASSSLHYAQDWAATLADLARITAGYLFVTRLPIIQTDSSYVMVQRPYRYQYNTEYLGWCLNHHEFLQQAESSGLKLLREFVTGEQPIIYRAPEQPIYYGFLFKGQAGNGTRINPDETDEPR